MVEAADMRRFLCLAVFSCAAFAVAPAAVAMPAPEGPRYFLITVGSRTATLSCTPGWPEPACTTLERVGGDLERLPRPEGVMCTMEYSPIRATATGVWDGREYHYDRTFSNACELAVTTGPVFAIPDREMA
jgi:hypothetical protein